MRNNAAILLTLLLTSHVAASELPIVSDSELSIGGVALDDTSTSVREALGRPTRVVETGDFLNVRLDYPGLTVWLGEGDRVGEILSTSSQHCTPLGVCPGQLFSHVSALYGPAAVAQREGGRFMEYIPTTDFPCWLQLAVYKGVVVSVRAECQP